MREFANRPTVSVVIPTYNGSRYLIQTIESVLNQNWHDYEIIVVDDGSQDNIEALLTRYKDTVSVFRIENKGPAGARNVGIGLSAGEFVALLDHDDVWAPRNLESKVKILRQFPDCSMVYSYPGLIDSEGNSIPQDFPTYFPSGSVFEDFLLRNRIVSFSCTLVRKAIFDRVGLLDERRQITCCDDYDMWLRIADISPIAFSPDKEVSYRVHDGNLIKNLDMSLNSHLTVYRERLKESKSVVGLGRKKLSFITREHFFERYHLYAFKYYYDQTDYERSRALLWRCIMLKPFVPNVWLYLLICFLPTELTNTLRRWKKKFCTG